jgi:hypothetical protein
MTGCGVIEVPSINEVGLEDTHLEAADEGS